MKIGIPLFPEQASEYAAQVDWLYAYLMGVSIFFTILISFLVVYFAVKYRRKSDEDRPPEIHGSNALEIFWSVIPFILSMIMFGWGASLYIKSSRAPDDAMEVLVTGKQWMWKIQHPSGKREINELHVPLGQAVKVTMTSEDVIHDFYVPAMRVKMDAVPGKYTSLWFKPNKLGKYHLFCAEYCGAEHSRMRGSVYVVTPAEYQAWVGGSAGSSAVAAAGGDEMSPADIGEQLFAEIGCVACHAAGASQLGPSLTGVYNSMQTLMDGTEVLANNDYLRESIYSPQAKVVKGFPPVMPTYKGQLTEGQLMNIIAYIKSLGASK